MGAKWLVVTSVIVAGCTPPTSGTIPPPAERKFFRLQNATSTVNKYCLDVAGKDSHKNGTKADIWHCNPLPGDPGQDARWYFQQEGKFVRIRNKQSDKCLEVRGVDVKSGGKVDVWDCIEGHEDMLWLVVRDQGDSVRIMNKVNGLCLGVDGLLADPGKRVETQLCKPNEVDTGIDTLWLVVP